MTPVRLAALAGLALASWALLLGAWWLLAVAFGLIDWSPQP